MSSPGLIKTPFSASDLFNTQSMAGAVFAQKKAFDDLHQSQKFGDELTPAMFSDVQQFLANPSSMQDHFNTMEQGYIAGNHFIPLASQSAASVVNAMGGVAGGVVGAGTPQLDTSGLNGAISSLTAAINKLSQSVGGGVTGAPSAVAGQVVGGQPAMTTGTVSSNTITTSIGGFGSPVTVPVGSTIAGHNPFDNYLSQVGPVAHPRTAGLFPLTSQRISPDPFPHLTFSVPTHRTPANVQVLRHRFNNFPTLADPITQMGPPPVTASFIPAQGLMDYDYDASFNEISGLLPSAPPTTGPQLSPPPPPPPLTPSQQLREAFGIPSHAQPDPLNLSRGVGSSRRPFPPSTSGHSIRGAFISGLAGGMVHQDHTFMQRQAVRVGRRLEQGLFSATRQAMDMDTGRTISETLAQLPAGARALSRGLQILDEQTNIQVPVNRALARSRLGGVTTAAIGLHERQLNTIVESGYMDLPDAAEFIATTTSLAGDTDVAKDLFFAHQIGEDAEGQAGLMGMLNARSMGGRRLTNQAVQRARDLGVRGAAVTIAADAEIQARLEERTSGVGTRGRRGRRGIIDEAAARGGADMQFNIASIKRGRSQILRARNLITDPFKGVGEALLFAHALEETGGDLVGAHHFLSDMSVSEKTSLFRSIGGKGLSDMLRLQGGEEKGDFERLKKVTSGEGVGVDDEGLDVAIERGKSQMAMRKRFESRDMQGINKVRIQKELDLDKGQLDRMQKVINETSDDFNTHVGKLITRVREVEDAMDKAAQKINAAVKKMSFDVDPDDKGVIADMKKLANIFSVILAKAGLNAVGAGLNK